jgi:hypothetical protein
MKSGKHVTLLALFCVVASAPTIAQSPPPPATEFISEFVIANRILADQGVIADGFGHLSARSPTDPNHFYMSRARAAGMVTVADVMEFDLGGQPLDQRDRRLFSERFIHAEIYKARRSRGNSCLERQRLAPLVLRTFRRGVVHGTRQERLHGIRCGQMTDGWLAHPWHRKQHFAVPALQARCRCRGHGSWRSVSTTGRVQRGLPTVVMNLVDRPKFRWPSVC